MNTGLKITNVASSTLAGFSMGASTGMPHVAGIGAAVGFVSGLFGAFGGSGGGGTGKGIGKKTKEAIRLENKYTLEQLKKDVALAKQANERAVVLYNDLRDAKYEQELKDYELAIEQRNTNYKQAKRLYKDSVKAFDETVELNNISASMAMNDARRVYNDRQQDLNNRAQALQLELSVGKQSFEINNALINNQMSASIRDAELNGAAINRRLRSAVREGRNAIQASTRAFEYATTAAANELAIKGIQLNIDSQMLQSEMATLKGEKDAIIASAQLKEQDVLNSLDNSIAEADFAQQTLQLAQDARYADAAIQTDQLRRQGLLQQGAQIAKGQSGRSAAKSVQGITFANQQAQALIASSIVRADAKFYIDRSKIAQTLAYARQQGQSELKSTAIGLDKAEAEFQAAGLRMGAKRSELGIRSLEADMVKDKLNFEKNEAQVKNRLIKAEVGDARALARIDLSRLSNQILSAQAQSQSQLANNALQQYNLEQQSKLSFESLAYAGQSLKDELKLGKERIKFDQFLANRAAASQVLDEPKLPELIGPPSKAPDLVQQPLPDIDWKRIEKMMKKQRKAKRSWSPAGSSDFNQFMSNINNIAEQAINVANSYKGAPDVMQTQDYFSSNVMRDAIQGNSAAAYQQPSFNLSAPTSYEYQGPDFQMQSNIFDADYSAAGFTDNASGLASTDINYQVPTPTTAP
jgi:hypothetical protein|tara:strand:+ start:3654 stop:5738 length:2085 start_codon:yes stop_codon:yes gene_type:complete